MSFPLVILYVAFCFLRPGDFFPGIAEYRPMLWLGSLTGVIVLVERLMKRQPLPALPQFWLVGLFVLAVSLSRLAQGWVGGAIYSLVELAAPIGVFYLVSISVNTLGRLNALVVALIVCSIALALQALIGYESGSESFFIRQNTGEAVRFQREYSEDDLEFMGSEGVEDLKSLRRIRSLGFLNDPNDFAQALIVIFPLLARFWRSGKWMMNCVAVLMPCGLFVWIIFLTQSRGAVIGLLALALLALRDRLGNLAALVLGGIAGAALLALKLLGGRSFSMSDASNYGRIDAWSAGIGMLREHPLFGVGFNNFWDHHPITAHNAFVLCFSELGALGYFVWLSILVVTWLQLDELTKLPAPPSDSNAFPSWANALRFSLVAFLVTSFFLSRTYTITLYLLAAMAAGLIGATGLFNTAAAVSPRRWVRWTFVAEIATIAIVYGFVRLGHLVVLEQ